MPLVLISIHGEMFANGLHAFVKYADFFHF